MASSSISEIAALLRERNVIDTQISRVIEKPMTSGHLGEWIASQIFDLELEDAANARGIDGTFRSGQHKGAKVNVKWYLRREGILDMTSFESLDFYLVLVGPVRSSRDSIHRHWRIEAVHLINARALVAEYQAVGKRIGTASSVKKAVWDASEVYPNSNDSVLKLSQEQRELLRLFSMNDKVA